LKSGYVVLKLELTFKIHSSMDVLDHYQYKYSRMTSHKYITSQQCTKTRCSM